jgi:putative oxidoreductase
MDVSGPDSAAPQTADPGTMLGRGQVVDHLLAFAGKLLIASLFWWSGIFDMLVNWPDVVGYVAERGIPAPALVAAGAAALEIMVPAALFVRRTEPLAALVLAAYCRMTALLFHDFWALAGDERTAQTIHFFKNMAIAGGLLVVFTRR